MKYKPVTNYIGEELVDGGKEKLDVLSPIDGSIISEVFLSTPEAVAKAVQTAKEAFPMVKHSNKRKSPGIFQVQTIA